MKLVLLLYVTLVCGGCAIPINHYLNDTPPWSGMVGKIIVTTENGTLARNNPTEPLGTFPDYNYCYDYTPASVYQLPYLTEPTWPTVSLAKGTKLKITEIKHVTYTPGPSFFSTLPSYVVHATTVSGPHVGICLWTFWGDSPQQSSYFSFAH